jgi:hypothetical protein
MDSTSLSKLFQSYLHEVLHTSDATISATRRALAMIVKDGPTPNEDGMKLPSTTKTSG